MSSSSFSSFHDFYERAGRTAVTAHAAYIGRYPENSLAGIQAAADIECDFVEFDVRVSKDGVPVLCHDETLGRTAKAVGRIRDFTVAELERFNFSHYEYFMDCSGRTLDRPLLESCPIACLEEVFARFGMRIFMNIQVYEKSRGGLESVCGLFREFNLYERGYFTVDDFEQARIIRGIDPEIELCVLNRPLADSKTTIAMLHDFHDFGCRIAQPRWYDITPEYCEASHELGIYSNVYYANYARDAKYFIECGIDGILTDYPDILLPLVNNTKSLSNIDNEAQVF